jgi:hypothetical protein
VDTALDKVSKLLDDYSKLGESLTDVAAAAKSGATQVASALKPDAMAKVPPLPPAVTGGADISKARDGKQGVVSNDLDGDGTKESVNVFADDGGEVFMAWQGGAGKADGWDDDGLCYLAWAEESGQDWLVVSQCSATDGAWVCQITESGAACQACNAKGECADCTEDGQASCTWPGYVEPQG